MTRKHPVEKTNNTSPADKQDRLEDPVKTVSRRNFIKNSALAGAGAAAILNSAGKAAPTSRKDLNIQNTRGNSLAPWQKQPDRLTFP